ncbi:MAG: hypothetical protein MOGMAGMI_01759 [Candidatus Omnitrophica bacterium]|nr:hypothetical protein [Candidatus Omnitrophota bacterium]
MSEATNSNKKFEEALHLLNEAAREKKDEIQRLLGDKYTHIRSVIQDASVEGRDRFDRLKDEASERWEEGQEQVSRAAKEIDKNVRQNPWPYIGGAAVGALLLGFLMGSSRRS